MSKYWVFILLWVCLSIASFGQGFIRQSFHDAERQHIKEIYHVKDTIRNTLHGKYISYFLNGNIESKGQFTNNETSGIWEFYFETGSIKMRGILSKGANHGFWEYFFESGAKNMEGTVYGRNKEGEWKIYYENGKLKEAGEFKANKRHGFWRTYFEDGIVKGEIEYEDDFGRYIEYDHSGKVIAEGPKMGTKHVGLWRYYAEDGTLQSEGEFIDGKKSGEWITYFSTGVVSSKGSFVNGDPHGKWEYYFENGSLSASGEFLGGQRNGYWKTFTDNGILMSETDYRIGTGEYREYHKSGKLKVKGTIVNNKKHGTWEFYFEGGQLEGKCEFNEGKGTYFGYYPGGGLQTKGVIDNNRKTGTWEIYDLDGKLSGYYKPFYDQVRVGQEVISYENQTLLPKKQVKKFTYFIPRANEFRGVIVGGNPVLMFAGMFPFGIEYYSQERLGHEFEFTGLRDPFFKPDADIDPGEVYERGYTIAIKQKFYNPIRTGMWYFGHEIRFTNLGHFTNVFLPANPDDITTISAFEQRMEYGILVGYRFMQRNYSNGITVDVFASVDTGYRDVDIRSQYETYFDQLNKGRLVTSFHLGINVGYVFSNR